MQKKLLNLYFHLFIPFVVLVIVFTLIEKYGIFLGIFETNKIGRTALILFSAFTGIIFPIWNRLILVKKMRDDKKIDYARFYDFEQLQIIVPLTTLYIVLLGYFMKVPKVQEFVLAIIGFYAAYYSFPSEKRISLDRKIFRIKDEQK